MDSERPLVNDRQRGDLETLRAALFEALDAADVAVKAQIAGQLRAVVKDLAALGEDVGEVSVADQLAAKRKARGAGPDGVASASRRGQPRRGGGRNRTG